MLQAYEKYQVRWGLRPATVRWYVTSSFMSMVLHIGASCANVKFSTNLVLCFTGCCGPESLLKPVYCRGLEPFLFLGVGKFLGWKTFLFLWARKVLFCAAKKPRWEGGF